ncbi:Tip elongation aberrant protein Tea4 [Cercospora beticola]|uniref:Tip elongation aberrant protein Tea4 n=1 Tax=Cercospora beticola TaxID=122368 RepID=A0A2G5I2R8_CERBT|nr:Tip elongation aberrant protein Tea4 [Cercospora beticola]PIA99104.1 Tip elongation aberrant protein Tea4 [Cercospora beticola]
MTRPNIVRADTLDLQDLNSPTAAEHAKHPPSNGNAPHLAAQVQHVLEERHSEEKTLADAWDTAANLDDQPATNDAADAQHAQEGVTNGQNGEEGAADGDGDADDDMMDRISSSPSIEDEDIDFEFVYALHTFVATVEGQANATKGDTMVLLDDSNSYWWLVRVVKDSSIGYLPAEHIETPTERLARLNKHRNIDLSATMLSDNSEKSRNPLKKAMRRRNAKTVQFAAPTYVEASDYDYSTEDEENLIEPAYGNTQEAESTAQEEAESEAEKAKKAEIEHPEAERRSSTGSNRASFDREQAAMAAQALAEAGVTGDGPHGPKTEAAPLKSKRTRNTDSFLKDDKIDTVRITLTPGLLREEQAKDGKSPSIDTARSSSFEELKPTTSPIEQASGKKEEKKKKEDKPKKSGGMLSGLFKSKKKDKKAKEAASDADSEKEKVSTELSRENSQRGSPNLSGKLSPIDKSSISSPTAFRHDYHEDGQRGSSSQDSTQASFVAELEGSRVAHEMGTSSPDNELGQKSSAESEAQTAEEAPQPEKPSGISKLQSSVAPFTNMLHLGDKEGKPAKAKKAKQRVELDDFDSPVDDTANPFEDQDKTKESERLSESPVEISSHTFMHGTETIHIPDTYNEDCPGTDTSGEPESLTSSPSIIDHPTGPGGAVSGVHDEDDDSTPTARSPIAVTPHEKITAGIEEAGTKSPATPKAATPQPTRGLSTDSTASKSSASHPSPSSFPSPATSQQSWSDESLKAWLEDGSEVRDMLVLIHDKSGIKPVAADHPLMVDLFTEQRKGVQNMMGELDGLLGSYLQRKGVRF